MFNIVIVLTLTVTVSLESLIYLRSPPLFSAQQRDRVEAGLGEEAVLQCQVDNLGQHTVSWTRQRDLQILTVGSHKFSTDQRLSVTFDHINKNFVLVIRGLSDQDFGNYECQINSNPVKIRVVRLDRTVITPPPGPATPKIKPRLDIPENSGSITSILGAPDIYFQPGSLVNITCVVNSLKRPEHIFWYHDGQVISYYSARGGVSIVRAEGQLENESRSTLVIRDGQRADQGTYTCRPLTGDFRAATTRLFMEQSQATHSSAGGGKLLGWAGGGKLLGFPAGLLLLLHLLVNSLLLL